MAAGTPHEGSQNNQEIELDTSKFNLNHFDDEGCIKLQVLMWLANHRFATTSLKLCIEPCTFA